MAKATIGGKDYNVKPLTFSTLSKVWPHIEEIQGIVTASGGDPLKMTSPIVIMKPAVAAVALMIAQDDPELQAIYTHPEHNGKSEAEIDEAIIYKVGKLVTSVEALVLENTINEIMAEAGFVAETPGEQKASPSTAIGTDSSLNSSPPVAKEAPGTE